jgi:hypothetical protein
MKEQLEVRTLLCELAYIFTVPKVLDAKATSYLLGQHEYRDG